MKLFGTILNGHVRLDQPTDLPDGTRIVSLVWDDFEDRTSERIDGNSPRIRTSKAPVSECD